MKYEIDSAVMRQILIRFSSDEERGAYIMKVADAMLDGSSKAPFITKFPKKSLLKKAKPEGYSPEFEAFWKLYPRKIGKGAAYIAWLKLRINEKALLVMCESSLEWQKSCEQWTKDQGQFIPHPQTYLHQRRWEDEAPEILNPYRKKSLGDII